MNIAIVGSRDIKNFDIGLYLPLDISMIVSGGACGVDQIAEEYATEHGIPLHIFKPDYKRYGRGAPLKRNEQIVDFSDVVVAFWDGVSRGTKYTIDYAKKRKKPVTIYVVT